MRTTLRLGRIRGIPVGVHWSLLVIGALLSWALATSLLPAAVPGAAGSYWAAAVLGAGLFLVSILLHELSHAVVAQRNGQQVDGITLWLFGGVARLGSDTPSAGAELRLALAGPAASLGIAAAFGALAAGLLALTGTSLLVAVLWWLALVNVVLAVFNLLPGAPLDGGRVLSALLWMRHGDRDRAHVTAARAGRVVGWALVGLSVAAILVGSPYGSLWTALIGWFVVQASAAEERAARVRGTLSSLHMRDIMRADPPVVRDWMTIADLVRELPQPGVHRFVALRRYDGEVGGVASIDALARVPVAARDDVRLRDLGIDRDHLHVASPDTPVVDVAFAPAGDRVPVVLVLDAEGRVVGIAGPAELQAAARGREIGHVPVPG